MAHPNHGGRRRLSAVPAGGLDVRRGAYRRRVHRGVAKSAGSCTRDRRSRVHRSGVRRCGCRGERLTLHACQSPVRRHRLRLRAGRPADAEARRDDRSRTPRVPRVIPWRPSLRAHPIASTPRTRGQASRGSTRRAHRSSTDAGARSRSSGAWSPMPRSRSCSADRASARPRFSKPGSSRR